MKILLGTNNKGKAKEMLRILEEYGIKALTPDDLSLKLEIEETGKTFKENAILKARAYMKASGLPAVSDDGGLEIDALGGRPGVLSRRWPGQEASDEELINLAIEKLRGVPEKKRGAQLRVVLAYVDLHGRAITQEGIIRGIIKERPSPKREPGYPFRSIFFIPKFKKFYIDLTFNEHKKINHRERALRQLITKILNWVKRQTAASHFTQ